MNPAGQRRPRGLAPRWTLAALLWPLLTAGGAPPPASLLPSAGSSSALTLALVGDISLARGVADSLRGDWAGALGSLRPWLGADATFGNLESPLTAAARATTGIDLRARPEAVAALSAFTHLGTENNHVLDGGAAGQAGSRAVLVAAGVVPVEARPTITLLEGRRVAWVGWFDPGTAPLADALREPLAAVRQAAQHASLVVVAAHWGEEYGPVSARQREAAQRLVDAGASLIVGSGPHVLQRAAPLRSGTGRTAWVLYSLGNLLFDQPYPAARVGAVVRVRVSGSAPVWTLCALPTRVRAGRVSLAAGDERRMALERLQLPPCSAGALP